MPRSRRALEVDEDPAVVVWVGDYSPVQLAHVWLPQGCEYPTLQFSGPPTRNDLYQIFTGADRFEDRPADGAVDIPIAAKDRMQVNRDGHLAPHMSDQLGVRPVHQTPVGQRQQTQPRFAVLILTLVI
jgi:hypothetical protein